LRRWRCRGSFLCKASSSVIPAPAANPGPAVIPAKAGITKHPGSSATRRNGVPRKAASRRPRARLVLLLRSPEGDRVSCLRRNDGGAEESRCPQIHLRLGAKACRGRLRTERPGHVWCSCCDHPKEIGIPACAGMTEERQVRRRVEVRVGLSPTRHPSALRSFGRPDRCPQAESRDPPRAGLRLT